jgi:hypothetical protein
MPFRANTLVREDRLNLPYYASKAIDSICTVGPGNYTWEQAVPLNKFH